jgi:hypothetical protein
MLRSLTHEEIIVEASNMDIMIESVNPVQALVPPVRIVRPLRVQSPPKPYRNRARQ